MTDNDNVTLDPDPLSKYTAAEAGLQSAADTAASAVPCLTSGQAASLALTAPRASVSLRQTLAQVTSPASAPAMSHTSAGDTWRS